MQGVSHSLRVLFAGLGLAAAAATAKADCVSACQASTYCDSEMNASGECGRRLNDCYINACNKTLYGAIAYGTESGAYGYSYDFADEQSAENEAMRSCSANGNDCKVVYQFWNSCAALAAASDGSYSIENADNEDAAQRRALAACEQKGGESCEIKVWSCTNN